MNHQVTILGGGIIGSFLGNELAKEGIDVAIVDQREEFGKKSCSGVVSKKVRDFVDVKSFRDNSLEKLKVNLPSSSFELNTESLVLDREKLDPQIIRKAKGNGVKVFKETRAQDIDTEKGARLRLSSKVLESQLFVDCSGVASFLANKKSLESDKKTFASALTRLDYKDEPKNSSEVFLDEKYSGNFFAWRIPRKGKVEYGVMTQNNAARSLDKFLKDMKRERGEIITHPVQIGYQKSVHERSLAVGESACQVKPLSGGGIIYGLICSEIAKEAILKSLEVQNYSRNFLERKYERKWKEEIGKSIDLQMEFREALYSKDLEDLKLPETSIDIDYDFLG